MYPSAIQHFGFNPRFFVYNFREFILRPCFRRILQPRIELTCNTRAVVTPSNRPNTTSYRVRLHSLQPNSFPSDKLRDIAIILVIWVFFVYDGHCDVRSGPVRVSGYTSAIIVFHVRPNGSHGRGCGVSRSSGCGSISKKCWLRWCRARYAWRCRVRLSTASFLLAIATSIPAPAPMFLPWVPSGPWLF